MRRVSFSRAWKTKPWLRRLFGAAILDDSTAWPFVAALMPCSPASPASLIRTPANVKASSTSAGYGPQSQDLFATLVRGSWFSKTCQDSFLPVDSLPFSQTWPRWSSMRNRECYLREAWAPTKSASACSSWPTARASDGDKGGPNQQGSKGDPMLPSMAAHWATPNAHDGRRPGVDDKSTQGGNLNRDAAKWMSPSTVTATGSLYTRDQGKKGAERDTLTAQAIKATWPTPNAADSKTSDKYPHKGGNPTLVMAAAKAWPAPCARIVKGGGLGSDAQGWEDADGHAGLGERALFAPGPDDERWAGIIADRPFLAPALESGVHVLVDGLPVVVGKSRSNQLRAAGNGVVPLQAAVAIVQLMQRLGVTA